MDKIVEDIIHKTVLEMLATSTSPANIQRMSRIHENKVHFVPIKYRVLGGILQGLNIKFGNFIETLMRNIVEIDPGVEIMPDSGKRIRLFLRRRRIPLSTTI